MYCGFAAVKNYVINKVTREYSNSVHFQHTCNEPHELGLSVK
jgi:hypothetical protein